MDNVTNWGRRCAADEVNYYARTMQAWRRTRLRDADLAEDVAGYDTAIRDAYRRLVKWNQGYEYRRGKWYRHEGV